MDGSATLTIAMSRMVMNCTARMSASANHFLLSELAMRTPVSSLQACRLWSERGMLQESACELQVCTFNLGAKRVQSARGSLLRPVLPDGARPRPRGRALVAAHRSRATRGRPAPLLGSALAAPRLRDEHPRRASEDARAGRSRPPQAARSAGRVVGLRAHRVRKGAS